MMELELLLVKVGGDGKNFDKTAENSQFGKPTIAK